MLINNLRHTLQSSVSDAALH